MASDKQSSDFGRRYQTLPSSAVVRPLPARRARATAPCNSPQICEESVYPVFNPLDPRHNPTAPASSWFDHTYCPPGPPSSPGSEGWMQSISKRSMRKARSGLQALRSGIQRRPLVDGFRRNGEILGPCSWLEGYPDQKENIFPSTVSEASTEEDTEFGSHLHRTECKSSPLTHSQDRPVPVSRFSSALAELSPFARRSEDLPDLPSSGLTGPVLSDRLHEPGNDNAELQAMSESSAVNCDIEPGDLLAARKAIQTSADSSRLNPLPRDSACSDVSEPIVVDTAGLAQTSSGIDGSEIGHVDKEKAHQYCQAHPSLDCNSPEPDYRTAHSEDAQKAIRNVDGVLPAPIEESHALEVNDIDLMMDTLGALDRLNIQESPNMGRTDPGSNDTSPGSPRRPRSSNTNGEGQSNASCNIRIQVQSGDWSRTLSPVPESTGLVDSSDFFGDQAAWSTRPSEEGATTDITSVSNAVWSPVENEDLTSLASIGDEYFLVDGKTSGFHPDRGGNPTKAERRLISDDSLYSDPGLERNPSVLTQEIPEMIGPGTPMRMPLSAPRPRDRDASDSTDEYLVTYPLFLKRYLS